MTKDDVEKTLLRSRKKSVFYQILRKKISILPNSEGKNSGYTDRISMSGRSGRPSVLRQSSTTDKTTQPLHITFML